MSTVYTPNCSGEYDFAKHDGKLAFWKQILPKKVVHYTAKDGSRQQVDFNDEYLTDLATSKAVDKIGFLLADKDNAHTMDPERWRGEVVQTEVRADGLYGKIVFPSPEAAAAVMANPDLPVSARIREGVSRSDGSTVRRGLIHVLGTLDPQVSGMSGWEATDLSNEGEDVLDLSNEEYEDMAEKKKSLTDYTDEDIDAMSEEELDKFLARYVPDASAYTGDQTKDALDSEDEVEDNGEADTAKAEAAKELVGAGADMSKQQEAKDIELANEAVAKANARANEAMRRVADAEWREERNSMLGKGVPPYVLDLAEPVLRRADDMVIDLSNSDEDDLDVTSIVRNLVKAFEGTVDLSAESGHNGAFHAEDGTDPDKALLDAWASQS